MTKEQLIETANKKGFKLNLEYNGSIVSVKIENDWHSFVVNEDGTVKFHLTIISPFGKIKKSIKQGIYVKKLLGF